MERFAPAGLLIAALFILVASACGGNPRIATPQSIDREIEADVLGRLDDARFKDVTVTCNGGLVKIDGTIPTQSDLENAFRIARGTPGVQQVTGGIRVR